MMVAAEAAKVPIERERRLILAILEEAVRSYQRYAFATNRRGRRLFWETCEWFAENQEQWVFSFENICHALDLEPNSIRQGLTRWRQTNTPRPATSNLRILPSGYRLRRAAG